MRYLLLILVVCGCVPNQPSQNPDKHTISVSSVDDANKLALVLAECTKEDQLKYYRYCRGCVLFVEESPNEMTVGEVFSTIETVQKSYLWPSDSKYQNSANAMTDYLVSCGFDKEDMPSETLKTERERIINAFNTLALAAKKAYEN